MSGKFVAIVWGTFLASAIQAGEIKVHNWPCAFIPQDVSGCEIPVLMDLDVVPICRILVTPVHLQQVGLNTYEGCTDLVVACNRNVTLSCSIVPTGLVGGKFSVSLSNPDIDAPGGTTSLCVKLTEAVIDNQIGRKRLRVATVTIRVTTR